MDHKQRNEIMTAWTAECHRNNSEAAVTTYHYLEDPVDSSAVPEPEWR